MGFAKIELALDPAPPLIFELAAAPQIVDLPPFRADKEEFDFVAKLGGFSVAVMAIAPELREFESICMKETQGLNDFRGESAFGGKLIEKRDRRLDALPARSVFFNPVGVTF